MGSAIKEQLPLVLMIAALQHSYSRPDGDHNGDGRHGDHVERHEEVLGQRVHALAVHLARQTSKPEIKMERNKELIKSVRILRIDTVQKNKAR